MTIDQIRTLHQAKPFKPFTIHIADGASYEVQHPENLLQSQGGRTLAVSTAGDAVVIIDLLLVTRITLGNGAATTRKRR
ncbi:MAG: hypothetical protein SFU86_16080 [Pirellulaceae bacterium]|nr:hypothetical protein [Pirellulaceae bacterium]